MPGETEFKFTNLDQIGTKELIGELSRRCEAILFIGVKGEEEEGDHKFGFWFDVEGEEILVEGALNILKHKIAVKFGRSKDE